MRETTFSSYELLVRLYVVPGLGKRRLRALQAQHIRAWLNGLRNVSVLCTGEGRRAGDEGQGAVLREETGRVLRAGRGYRYLALFAPTCACGTARRR
ncbi:tyrosine-type recombinase/integrase [Mycobacterium kansasii]